MFSCSITLYSYTQVGGIDEVFIDHVIINSVNQPNSLFIMSLLIPGQYSPTNNICTAMNTLLFSESRSTVGASRDLPGI